MAYGTRKNTELELLGMNIQKKALVMFVLSAIGHTPSALGLK
jgi:hypothetical protein